MNNEIEHIKNILINVYEDECGFNEGSFTYNILLEICNILDDIKEYIFSLEDKK